MSKCFKINSSRGVYFSLAVHLKGLKKIPIGAGRGRADVISECYSYKVL